MSELATAAKKFILEVASRSTLQPDYSNYPFFVKHGRTLLSLKS